MTQEPFLDRRWMYGHVEIPFVEFKPHALCYIMYGDSENHIAFIGCEICHFTFWSLAYDSDWFML